MRYTFVLLAVTAIPFFTSAQQKQLYDKQGGTVSFGVRSTVSAFSHGENEVGYGAGGHLRIQLTDRINTEWFMDILSTNIEDKAQRMDYHVGWSVMYYLIKTNAFTRKVTPFVVAGHCFDYTNISENGTDYAKGRWSTAVQAGAGFHYNITPKFDLTSEVQYMMHLGRELHAHISGDGIEIEEHPFAGWQGHMLFNVSMNYKFLQLWKPGKRS